MYLPGLKNEYPIYGALHTHTQLVSYPFWAVFTTQNHSNARQMAMATTVAKKNQKHSYPCHTIPAHGHRGAGYAPLDFCFSRSSCSSDHRMYVCVFVHCDDDGDLMGTNVLGSGLTSRSLGAVLVGRSATTDHTTSRNECDLGRPNRLTKRRANALSHDKWSSGHRRHGRRGPRQ